MRRYAVWVLGAVLGGVLYRAVRRRRVRALVAQPGSNGDIGEVWGGW